MGQLYALLARIESAPSKSRLSSSNYAQSIIIYYIYYENSVLPLSFSGEIFVN